MIENQKTEFKLIWKDEYLKQVCGFANTNGGTLYIGLNDNGKVVGVADAKKLLDTLPNIILQTMGLIVDMEHLTEDEKDYIALHIEKSYNPVSYHGKFYVRSGATLQELTGVALQKFLMSRMKIEWDTMVCEQATMDDIDPEAISFFLEASRKANRLPKGWKNGTTEDLLDKLGVLTEDGQLTNAAILLFGKDPQRRFPHSYFRLGRFGRKESDLRFQDEIGGNIIEMTTNIIKTLRSTYLTNPIHYEGLQRVEEMEIPEKAMRELLHNAIVHRDYMGMDSILKVYDDRIWLWNEGEMPKGYTTETMLKPHRSKPRNKQIASVFFRAGFIESWGRGWDTVYEEFSSKQMEMPTIETYDEGTLVVIKRPVDQRIETTDVYSQLSERKQKILLLIQGNAKITGRKMAESISVSESLIWDDLKELQAAKIILREGNNRKGRWLIVEQSVEQTSEHSSAE